MQNQLEQYILPIVTSEEEQILFGPQDRFIHNIEDAFQTQVLVRNGQVTLTGQSDNVQAAVSMLEELLKLIRKGYTLTDRDILYAIQLAQEGLIDQLSELFEEEITKTYKGKPIRVKTLGQRHYVSAIHKHDIVFGIGPAGTGKTYLAVVLATHYLKKGLVKRIVLTRPAVEAGENLGFLPGDLQEKVDPYLRPLYDALHDVLGVEQVLRYLERGTIEIAPLAYMRGRTLDDSFVILDEAQNTTPEQMKMFLTRLGFGSKMVITGDRTQIDLPKGKKSGLIEAEGLLRDVDGLCFIYLQQADVVRHPLVQKIIEAYDRHDR
ncbi:phosphate starvation-inducible PhoH-like protein [Caldalkalibacillus uzonensis]|uniref:PhoH-like protein n=1 Tax=Caldalkalibacillus uzonensis TaxID=353224 RepID=A0ABU0CT97_9BACI|nr:PhoH family protein [Caldalkalibacillus uzonensis]MDQ0339639.1 phosphate starvation-inducible PhoH-like protein [Caldalkalibacillus uzonensis]